MKSLWKWIEDPVNFRRINGWLTVIWFIAAFPICVLLAKSLPFIVFISVYAVVASHLATWQAGNVEVRQINDDPTDKKVDEIHKKIAR